jgi:ATP synthase protein I
MKDDDAFVDEVRRQAERVRAGRHQSFWQNLATVGAVGWMVCLPAVLGAFLGRWLDGRAGGGIFWTLSLLGAGLAIGCGAAWRHVRRELKG